MNCFIFVLIVLLLFPGSKGMVFLVPLSLSLYVACILHFWWGGVCVGVCGCVGVCEKLCVLFNITALLSSG